MIRARRLLGALTGAATLAAGCGGGGDSPPARVAWAGTPQLLHPATAERALIVQGVIRNTGSRRVTIRADQVQLSDGDGNLVKGTAVFLSGYVRPGEAQNRGPAELSGQEQERLGKVARIGPGQTTPLVVSWRARDGHPSLITYPGGSLEVPAR